MRDGLIAFLLVLLAGCAHVPDPGCSLTQVSRALSESMSQGKVRLVIVVNDIYSTLPVHNPVEWKEKSKMDVRMSIESTLRTIFAGRSDFEISDPNLGGATHILTIDVSADPTAAWPIVFQAIANMRLMDFDPGRVLATEVCRKTLWVGH
jgi:hypothetical protein